MKKILLIAVGLALVATAANAQIADNSFRGNDNAGSEAEVTAVGTIPMTFNVDDAKYLLMKQNKILKNRKTGMIVTCASLGTEISGVLVWSFVPSSNVGPVMCYAGGVATIIGCICLIANEFNLIDNQRALNNMHLAAIPGGLALKF